ncbi:hypothetical protein, partial [Halomonas sp. BC1]|uniref:hypothetical protein n=1 Tax=Halomonas sp. BC1 TaxID=1670448 RepID=UPI001C37EE27
GLGDCSGYKPMNGLPTGRLGTALFLLNKKSPPGGWRASKGLAHCSPLTSGEGGVRDSQWVQFEYSYFEMFAKGLCKFSVFFMLGVLIR